MIGSTAKSEGNHVPEVAIGDDANSAIQNLIDESAHVLDFTAEINDDNRSDRAVGMAIGLADVDGEPGNLVLSFAVEHTDEDNVIVGEEKRTTIILPLSQTFTFGNGVVAVCDALHDYLMEKKIREGANEIINSLSGNQKP